MSSQKIANCSWCLIWMVDKLMLANLKKLVILGRCT